MDFDKLVVFFSDGWPTIAAVAVIVAPISWVITRWLYENRIEEVNAENRRLKASAPIADTAVGATATDGVAQAEWVETRQTHGATYTYRLSLKQRGALITGTGNITRVGPDPYDQYFAVEGKEFAGCVLLTLTSASAGSTAAVAALMRVVDRGAKLSGYWSYRTRVSDDVVGEPVSLSRQVSS